MEGEGSAEEKIVIWRNEVAKNLAGFFFLFIKTFKNFHIVCCFHSKVAKYMRAKRR